MLGVLAYFVRRWRKNSDSRTRLEENRPEADGISRYEMGSGERLTELPGHVKVAEMEDSGWQGSELPIS